MRDLHLRHTLKLLARDASAVFADLLEGGQEIPYEITEPGPAAAFCHYRPLTARFVRDNATELRELESFAEATETMRSSDLAADYLEEAGITPPADPVERATLAVTYFLARLWDGCSEFEIDEDRFESALEEVEECSDPEVGELEAVVPLIGFTSELDRIELNGASIVRADTVDAPPEAVRSDRPAGGDWQPSYLVSTRVALDPDGGLAGAGGRVAQTFDRVVTTLRLLQRGGVGLGPHGWVRVAGDRWRRITTGAGRPRSGGYRLDAADVEPLADLSRTLSLHPNRVGRVRRALLRFESGLDRRGAVDALNDHLLGLRFLLEGEGPAGAGLPVRAAALAAEGEDRDPVRATVERAIALERELWSGEPTSRDSGSPSEVAMGVEELLRTILTRAVSGELGADLRAAADETLLADGLAVGEGSGGDRGGTSEWELDPDAADAEDLIEAELDETDEAAEAETEAIGAAEAFERFDGDPGATVTASRAEDEDATGENDSAEDVAYRAYEAYEDVAYEDVDEDTAYEEDAYEGEPGPPAWLEEVGGEETMDFPARDNHLADLAKPPMDREEVRARVEYLFPRTETDWTVGEDSGSHAAAG